MSENKKIKLAISIGDINGIGPEIILKSFRDKRMLDFFTPVVFASSKVISYHKKTLDINTPVHVIDDLEKIHHSKLNVLNITQEEISIDLGKETKEAGQFAFESLEAASLAVRNGEMDVLVTAPINKHNIQNDHFNFSGHTEYLGKVFQGDPLMILMSEGLKVGLVTGHVPVSQVSELITADRIQSKVELMHRSLKQDFALNQPKIALLGLNPHCGDQGLIGSEDDQIIKPLVREMFDKGYKVFGPYAADGFFGSKAYENFDGVLAMYHDQGLVGFKALSFGNGVNYTAGLSEIRTSPDHGTGYAIAGKGTADEQSFLEAMFQAKAIFNTRKTFLEAEENALKASN